MPDVTHGGPAPDVNDVERIAAIANPVIRNLEITYCYSRLAAAFAARGGAGANWCTYATWASRQAGGTIRGEDLFEHLGRKLGEGRWLLHPIATPWRRLLRRGLFQRDSRIGRLTSALHTPFDAFERASDAVARGNLKVFEEIGLEFARYLHECPPDTPAESLRSSASSTGSGPAIRPRASATCARRSLATNAAARARPEGACAARRPREPRDRLPRADTPATGDSRGSGRPLCHAGGSG